MLWALLVMNVITLVLVGLQEARYQEAQADARKAMRELRETLRQFEQINEMFNK